MSYTLSERLIMPGSPFELVSTADDSVVFRHCPRSLNELYQKAAGSSRQTYLIEAERHISYGEILCLGQALGKILRTRYGILHGKRVAIVLPSDVNWLVSFIAISCVGGVVVLIEREMPLINITKALDMSECTLVLCDKFMSSSLADHAARRPLLELRSGGVGKLEVIDGEQSVWLMHSGALSPFDDVSVGPDQDALIAFTSGTTGTPKGVVSSHRAVLSGMMNMMLGSALSAIRNKTRAPALMSGMPASLLLTPFSHIGGYSHLLLMMRVGGRIMPMRRWNIDAALSAISKERLRTISGATPEAIRGLLNTDLPYDVSCLTGIGVHGSAIRTGLLKEFNERFPNVQIATSYGLTETNGAVCTAMGKDLVSNPRSSGPVTPSVQLQITGEDDRTLPTGNLGEISIKGPMLMQEYCGAPHATARALRDGWLRTADFGHLDSNGNLVVAERQQDLIRCGGQQFSYSMVERIAFDSGHVDDAAALVVSDSIDCERLILAIVPNKSHHGVRHELAKLLSEHPTAFRCKFEIVELDRMPRTPSGKIDRRALRHCITE